MEIKYVPAGDSALVMYFSEEVDLKTNKFILALWNKVLDKKITGVLEAVPTYCTLCIYYNPAKIRVSQLKEILENMREEIYPDTLEGKTFDIPVVYGSEYGPDLAYVSSAHGLTAKEVVDLHSAPTYHVYMVGFAPGFPYLGGLSEKLFTPRKKTPALGIPAGSVGIGGQQTAVLSVTGPSGWYFIGRTPVKFYDIYREPPILIKPGDKIKFKPITEAEYQKYAGEG